MHSVETNGIKNSLITHRDIEISIKMLGPSKYAAQGKTTRKKVEAIDITL